jgi:predicted protein tyrosine phosphatase
MAEPYEIVPRVWFGPAIATERYPTRFTHIINCEEDPRSTSAAARNHIGAEGFLFLASEDDDNFPIMDKHFAIATAFIDTALQSSPTANVYIHCVMGINRSGALAVAYAAQKTRTDLDELIALTRRRSHRLILTNQGFYRQLQQRYDPTRSNTDPRI